MADEYTMDGGRITKRVGRHRKPGPKKGAAGKPKAKPKVHVGPMGGKYMIRRGKKVYV